MRRGFALGLGTLMIAGGMLGASLTFGPSLVDTTAQERGTPQQEHSAEHEQMHTMMDMMMGAGASEQMHAEMPGSEEMMDACASGMGTMMDDGMMDGMDQMPATPEAEEGS